MSAESEPNDAQEGIWLSLAGGCPDRRASPRGQGSLRHRRADDDLRVDPRRPRARASAEAVVRLERAGYVNVGKTNSTSSPTASPRRTPLRNRSEPDRARTDSRRLQRRPGRRARRRARRRSAGPTRAARSASPLPAAGSSASSRATASSLSTAASRSHRRSTTPGRWPARRDCRRC